MPYLVNVPQRNVFGSGVLCADCSGGIDDDELSPYNPLSAHLLEMATQRPVNTQAYITAHAGMSAMFPLAYPQPPTPIEPPGIATGVDAISSESEGTGDIAAVTAEGLSKVSIISGNSGGESGGGSGCGSGGAKVAGSSCQGRPDADLLMDYLLFTCNQKKHVAQQCVQQSSLPGPKATPLHLKDVSMLVCPYADDTPPGGICGLCNLSRPSSESHASASDVCRCCEYVVCEKTDGERALLVVSPAHGGEIYFVGRNMQVLRLELADSQDSDIASSQTELNKWLQALPGVTILDGELVNRYGSGEDGDSTAFMVFDAVFVDGEFIGVSPQYNLLSRLQRGRDWLYSSVLNATSFSTVSLFQCKAFYPAVDAAKVTARFTPNLSLSKGGSSRDGGNNGDSGEAWGWIYDADSSSPEAFPHMSDGLVFTPIRKNYYEYMAIKYKPPHMCTVDFGVQLSEIQQACRRTGQRGGGRGEGIVSVSGFVRGNGPKRGRDAGDEALTSICQVSISITQAQELLSASECGGGNCRGNSKPTHAVAECMFRSVEGDWFAVRLRTDRATPNSLRTAWSNLEVIAERVTLEILLQHLRDTYDRSQQALISSANVSGDGGGVSEHYDRIQQQRKAGARDERIAVHRKVMNWAKACLLHCALSPHYRGLGAARLPSSDDMQYHLSTSDGGAGDGADTREGDSPVSSPGGSSVASAPSPIAGGITRRKNSHRDTYKLSTDGDSVLRGNTSIDVRAMTAYLQAAATEAGLLSSSAPSASIYPPDLQSRIPPNSFHSGPGGRGGSGGEGRGGRGRGGRGGPSSAAGGSINVLDLACGRGGDTKKFTSDHIVDIYVGVDVSEEQVKECHERVREGNRRIKRCEMFLGDAACGQWKQDASLEGPIFDLAWCMFALHYFCDTEDHCRALLSHVADSLKEGGKFVASFPNPCSVHSNLAAVAVAGGIDTDSGADDCVCKIEPLDKSVPFIRSLEECLHSFGIEYNFTLGDAVEVN
jgi:SAM-dependent methyltransferase